MRHVAEIGPRGSALAWYLSAGGRLMSYGIEIRPLGCSTSGTKESWRRGELVPNAGHWLAEEQPKKIVEILLDFFSEN